MRRRRMARKGLQKMGGRPTRAAKYEQDLTALKRIGRMATSLSPDARRWLRSKLA